ncbi:UPF0301 protein ML0028 [Striga asiatica]|uniref:UPF0301 protein ML0028 n=1 Tax=Striga asiatica TaxID=4170 RepID=A0A5A7PHH7_STRAF|nr:UPF0301 protein ML0028 [Striga asiatica]
MLRSNAALSDTHTRDILLSFKGKVYTTSATTTISLQNQRKNCIRTFCLTNYLPIILQDVLCSGLRVVLQRSGWTQDQLHENLSRYEYVLLIDLLKKKRKLDLFVKDKLEPPT